MRVALDTDVLVSAFISKQGQPARLIETIRQIGKTDKWERVRIEFEYKSSDFEGHGHLVGGCDLIVCWIDDWKDCPLEVLELSKVIKKLGA